MANRRVRLSIDVTNPSATPPPPNQQARLIGIRYFIVLWLLFFAICFGLGYPTLGRYDPRTTAGLSDAPKYHALVTGADTSSFKEIFRGRVLVPYVARPFYWLAQNYLHARNPGLLALLVSNSLFCATTACLVVGIGKRLLNDLSTALLGAALYLLSFTVPNLQLSGLIDAGESCFMAAVVWSLLNRRWYLLPIWAVLGALAKETFVPFSSVFVFTWWLMEARQNEGQRSRLKWGNFKWIVALGLLGLGTVSTVHSLTTGQFKAPWDIAGQASAGINFFKGLWDCLTERSFWYVFGWLLPLGVWRLRYFPKPWVMASISACTLAIILGAYNNVGGTIGRGAFNIIGPLLSLSVALLIARPSAKRHEHPIHAENYPPNAGRKKHLIYEEQP